MKISVLLLAAGAGLRFRASHAARRSASDRLTSAGLFSRSVQFYDAPRLPVRFRRAKVFAMLAGKPMIQHSLEVLARFSAVEEIIIVVPASCVSFVKCRWLARLSFEKPVYVMAGGKERSDSSWRGLNRISAKATHVLIHDAARPLVGFAPLAALFQTARVADGALLAKPVAATLKRVQEGNRKILLTVPRAGLWEAETPQIFRKEIIKKAYQAYVRHKRPATDDAALCEEMGATIKTVMNPACNIKVTTVPDLHVAAAMLGETPEVRAGLGYDIHRLVPGRKLMLGGVHIPAAFGSLGHSDGDVVLHALIDALLGASGAGDIGTWFPDTARRYRGVNSTKLFQRVLQFLRKKSYIPQYVDMNVHLEHPKLGHFKMRIRENLARLLALPPEHINIKAKTAEGLGCIGKGKAVAAQVIVTLGVRRG